MQSKQLHLSEKINIPWTCKPGRMGEKPARLLATCIFHGAAGCNSSLSAIHHLGWLLLVRMCACGRGTGKLQGAPSPLVGPWRCCLHGSCHPPVLLPPAVVVPSCFSWHICSASDVSLSWISASVQALSCLFKELGGVLRDGSAGEMQAASHTGRMRRN